MSSSPPESSSISVLLETPWQLAVNTYCSFSGDEMSTGHWMEPLPSGSVLVTRNEPLPSGLTFRVIRASSSTRAAQDPSILSILAGSVNEAGPVLLIGDGVARTGRHDGQHDDRRDAARADLLRVVVPPDQPGCEESRTALDAELLVETLGRSLGVGDRGPGVQLPYQPCELLGEGDGVKVPPAGRSNMIGVVEPRILAEVRLGRQHRRTGFTRHYYGYADGLRVEVPPPVVLRIVQYDGDELRAYLFYCDDSGEEMTDTLHDSVAEAMDQATAEFGVQRQDWDLRQ